MRSCISCQTMRLVIGILFLFSTQSLAQYSLSPSSSIDSLLETAENIWQGDIDSAIDLAHSALRKANSSDDPFVVAKAHLALGNYYQYSGAASQAFQHLKSAEQLYHRLGFKNEEASALHNIGLLYAGSEDVVRAREYYLKALFIEEEIDDYRSMTNTLIKLADAYIAQRDYPSAKKSLKRALTTSKRMNFPILQSISSSNLAALYSRTDSLDLALKWYDRALELTRSAGSPHAEAILLLEMSKILLDQASFLKARERIDSALKIARDSGSELLIGTAYDCLARLYSYRGNPSKASEYFNRSMKIYQRSNFKSKQLSSGIQLAHILLKMNRLDSVYRLSNQLALTARKAGNWQKGEQLLLLALEVSEMWRDSGKMADIQSRLLTVRDSLYKMDKQDRMNTLESQYALFEKEQELEVMKEREQRQQLWKIGLIGSILFLFIIGGLLINSQRLKVKTKESELKLSRLEQKKLKTELELKNKQLTTHALQMAQKNQFLTELREDLDKIEQDIPDSVKSHWNRLKHRIDYSFTLDEDWEQFKLQFEEVHEHFFAALKETAEELRPNDYRIAALARLNLSIKEMASLLNISPDSVKVARYRLRKKLPLETEEHLSEFLSEMEENYHEET